MSTFWDGFEKKAISSALLGKAVSSAENKLLRDYHGTSPLTKKVRDKIFKQREKFRRAIPKKEIKELETSWDPITERYRG